MRLLIRSMFRHLRQHLLQTFFTMAVSILITGMLAVLFHFASSFQCSLRNAGLEKYGTYHYKYYTKTGTGAARVFAEMARRFQEDRWFSDVQFVEDGSQVYLILTVAHPGSFTSKTMEKKFNKVVEDCREWTKGETFLQGMHHNWDLLASYGDLERANGIYAYLLVFLFLLAAIAAAAVLTLGSVFRVSAMQREREIALLAGMGAGKEQIIGMILLESFIYCLVSLPAGFWLGIFVYRGIQRHVDNIIYSLFRFPPADLVVSGFYSVALAVCAVCVILLSGLRSAMRVSRISPMEALRRTTEIQIQGEEINAGQASPGKSASGKGAVRGTWGVPSRRKVPSRQNVPFYRKVSPYQDAPFCERWLAEKSWQRFKRRNKPILIMLAVTFALCFVLDGFRRYSTEVVKMSFDTISYNFSIDLYGDDKSELERLASALAFLPASTQEGGLDGIDSLQSTDNSNGIGSLQSTDNPDGIGGSQSAGSRFAAVREAIYELRSPYPLSNLGEASLLTNGIASNGMLPDVVLQCIDEESFNRICAELGIPGEAEGLWGIFMNTERSWYSDGVMVKGRPYAMAAGEQIRFYGASGNGEDKEEFILNVAGVYDRPPLYADVTASARMQILVPYAVYSMLEEKGSHMGPEAGIYHISLRGNVEDGQALRKMVEEQAGSVPGVTCRISDDVEELRQEKSGIDSFEFLCGALVGIFAFICICGNFTLSWAVNKAREREFATLLSVGMEPGGLQKMRLFELTLNVWYAFLPGVLAGVCAYQVIYLMYTSEYRISWHFPLTGFLLGTSVLVISMGVTDLALRLGSGKKSLSEQLRMEE